jgi:hypothetical protein
MEEFKKTLCAFKKASESLENVIELANVLTEFIDAMLDKDNKQMLSDLTNPQPSARLKASALKRF